MCYENKLAINILIQNNNNNKINISLINHYVHSTYRTYFSNANTKTSHSRSLAVCHLFNRLNCLAVSTASCSRYLQCPVSTSTLTSAFSSRCHILYHCSLQMAVLFNMVKVFQFLDHDAVWEVYEPFFSNILVLQ